MMIRYLRLSSPLTILFSTTKTYTNEQRQATIRMLQKQILTANDFGQCRERYRKLENLIINNPNNNNSSHQRQREKNMKGEDSWEGSDIYSLSQENINKIKEMSLKQEMIALLCRNFSKHLRKLKNNETLNLQYLFGRNYSILPSLKIGKLSTANQIDIIYFFTLLGSQKFIPINNPNLVNFIDGLLAQLLSRPFQQNRRLSYLTKCARCAQTYLLTQKYQKLVPLLQKQLSNSSPTINVFQLLSIFNFIGSGKSNSYVVAKEIEIIKMGLQSVLKSGGIENGVPSLVSLYRLLNSFMDYSVWQYTTLQGLVLETQKYWEKMLFQNYQLLESDNLSKACKIMRLFNQNSAFLHKLTQKIMQSIKQDGSTCLDPMFIIKYLLFGYSCPKRSPQSQANCKKLVSFISHYFTSPTLCPIYLIQPLLSLTSNPSFPLQIKQKLLTVIGQILSSSSPQSFSTETYEPATHFRRLQMMLVDKLILFDMIEQLEELVDQMMGTVNGDIKVAKKLQVIYFVAIGQYLSKCWNRHKILKQAQTIFTQWLHNTQSVTSTSTPAKKGQKNNAKKLFNKKKSPLDLPTETISLKQVMQKIHKEMSKQQGFSSIFYFQVYNQAIIKLFGSLFLYEELLIFLGKFVTFNVGYKAAIDVLEFGFPEKYVKQLFLTLCQLFLSCSQKQPQKLTTAAMIQNGAPLVCYFLYRNLKDQRIKNRRFSRSQSQLFLLSLEHVAASEQYKMLNNNTVLSFLVTKNYGKFMHILGALLGREGEGEISQSRQQEYLYLRVLHWLILGGVNGSNGEGNAKSSGTGKGSMEAIFGVLQHLKKIKWSCSNLLEMFVSISTKYGLVSRAQLKSIIQQNGYYIKMEPQTEHEIILQKLIAKLEQRTSQQIEYYLQKYQTLSTTLPLPQPLPHILLCKRVLTHPQTSPSSVKTLQQTCLSISEQAQTKLYTKLQILQLFLDNKWWAPQLFDTVIKGITCGDYFNQVQPNKICMLLINYSIMATEQAGWQIGDQRCLEVLGILGYLVKMCPQLAVTVKQWMDTVYGQSTSPTQKHQNPKMESHKNTLSYTLQQLKSSNLL